MAEKQLAVWLGDRRVGTLVGQRQGGFRFDGEDGAAALTVSREVSNGEPNPYGDLWAATPRRVAEGAG